MTVAESGRLAHFDFFVLSDSTDPDIWINEEAQYLSVSAQTAAKYFTGTGVITSRVKPGMLASGSPVSARSIKAW